ncbi:MAG TPA: ABC transporter ATP-binding protein, partial [Ktedonobacteraceae bacterium]
MPTHHSGGVTPKTFRRVLQTFCPYWRWCLLIVLTTLAIAASGTLGPIAMGLIIDRAFPHKDLPLLTLLVLVLVILPVIAGFISIGQDYANATVGQRVMHDLRVTLYAHLQAVSMRFYTAQRTGEILSRFTNDINGVQTIVTTTLSLTLLNSLTVLATFVVMVRLNVPLTALSLGLVPLFLLLTYRVGMVRRRVSRSTQQSMADLSSILEETVNVSGALLVRSFGHQRTQTQRFAEASKRLEMTQIHQTMLGRWFFLIFHIFFAVAPALVYYIGGLQVIGGTLSLGSLVAFTALQSTLFRPLGDLLNTHVDVQG